MLFERQYASASKRHQARPPRLEVVRAAPGVLRITDTRDDKVLFYEVAGAAAQIYDACHCGLKLNEIVATTGLTSVAVKTGLTRFLRSKLVLQIDDYYLSLATRPRNELLQRFYDSDRQGLQPAKPLIESDKSEQMADLRISAPLPRWPDKLARRMCLLRAEGRLYFLSRRARLAGTHALDCDAMGASGKPFHPSRQP